MSGVAGLFNVPSINEELWTWNATHASHHRDIIRIVYEIFGLTLDESILDPFDPTDAEDWLQNHQIMHQQMDVILGISGYNLLAVDMTNAGQFSNWVFLNADEHFKAANILGFG